MQAVTVQQFTDVGNEPSWAEVSSTWQNTFALQIQLTHSWAVFISIQKRRNNMTYTVQHNYSETQLYNLTRKKDIWLTDVKLSLSMFSLEANDSTP